MEQVIFSTTGEILTSVDFATATASATTITNSPQSLTMYVGFIGASGITSVSATTSSTWLTGSFEAEEVYTIKVMKLTGVAAHNLSGENRTSRLVITSTIDGSPVSKNFDVTQSANISNFLK